MCMEIALCKVNSHFLAFRSNNFGKPLPIHCMEKIIGANRAEKCAITLHSWILVMDRVNINNRRDRTPVPTH